MKQRIMYGLMKINVILILFLAIFHICESSCLNSYHKCGPSDLFKCIPETWKCDSNIDCEDGSDEINCPLRECGKNQFKCINSYDCISHDLVCDGKSDCFDNSDEENCTKLKGLCNEKTEYDCQNTKKLECIPLEVVCNKKYNCSTNRNNNENCNKDMCISNPCSHTCINKYSSFVCDCPPGMFLAQDKKTCKHLNNCLERPNLCPQECSDKSDGYQCSCYKGYTMSGDQCVSQYPANRIYLFYSSFEHIYGLHIFDTNITNFRFANNMLENPSRIWSFDVKLDNNYLALYSTFTDKKNILAVQPFESWPSYLTSLTNNKYSREKYVEKYLKNSTISSVALDPARNLLFFIDVENRYICVMNLTSLDEMKIIEKDIYEPVALAIDPVSARLFWIDLGSEKVSPKIEMANMDGSSRKIILENNLHKPISLAIDIDEQKLYWANHFPPSINFLDLNILNKNINKITVVIENILLQPFSIAIFGNRIYWSDWHQNRIYSAHKISGKGVKMIKECIKPMSIRIVSKQFNEQLIENVNKQSSSKSCSGLKNTCPYSCLPKFNSPESPICFGSAPEIKRNYSLWFILIPIILIIIGFFGIRKFRKSKSNVYVQRVSTENLCDNVKFWDEDNRSCQEEGITNTSVTPILDDIA